MTKQIDLLCKFQHMAMHYLRELEDDILLDATWYQECKPKPRISLKCCKHKNKRSMCCGIQTTLPIKNKRKVK